MNLFSIMVRKRIRNEEDADDKEEEKKEKKKSKKSLVGVMSLHCFVHTQKIKDWLCKGLKPMCQDISAICTEFTLNLC